MIDAVVAICAAATLLAVAAASSHAAAIGCEASRQQLQVAAAGVVTPDPASEPEFDAASTAPDPRAAGPKSTSTADSPSVSGIDELDAPKENSSC